MRKGGSQDKGSIRRMEFLEKRIVCENDNMFSSTRVPMCVHRLECMFYSGNISLVRQ